MSQYIDGFVIPLPADKVELYRQSAEAVGQIWMEFGALEFRECIGDDFEAPHQVSFPALAKAQEGETVAFSWIAYRSREHRDEVNARVMADPRLEQIMEKIGVAFDCSRMAYGGFKTLVHLTPPTAQ